MKHSGKLLALTAVLVTLLSLSDAATAKVRPLRGIGPLNLGMTTSKVRNLLGKPNAIRSSRVRGRQYVQYDYTLTKSWRVTFVRQRTRYLVVGVATTSPAQKTARRLGVGATEPQLRKAYRALMCTNLKEGAVRATLRECVVRYGRRELVFVVGRPPNSPEVLEVAVRLRSARQAAR